MPRPALTWCPVHECERVRRTDQQGTRCPRCESERQERYRREVLGRPARGPVERTPVRWLTAVLSSWGLWTDEEVAAAYGLDPADVRANRHQRAAALARHREGPA